MCDVVGKLILIGRTRQPRVVYEVAIDGQSRVSYGGQRDFVCVSDTVKDACSAYIYQQAGLLQPYTEARWQACQAIIRQKNEFRKYYADVIAALRRGEIPQHIGEWTPPGCR